MTPRADSKNMYNQNVQQVNYLLKVNFYLFSN